MIRQKSAAASHQINVPSVQVRARVNRFLLSEVGSQFAAGDPEFDAANNLWQVPLLLITPGLVVGQAGEAIVSAESGEIISHTEIEQIHAMAASLRKRHHAPIKAAFLRSGKR